MKTRAIVALLFLFSQGACLAAIPPHISDGRPSAGGAWRGGGLRPAIQSSPSLAPSAPRGATIPGMPAVGVEPYRPRVSAILAAFVVITLTCAAPEASGAVTTKHACERLILQ